MSQTNTFFYFASPIYTALRSDFLESVSAVSDEYLDKNRAQQTNEIYPVVMSDNYYHEERISGFSEFIGVTAWDILSSQGYDMKNKYVSFTEMWTQEHHKHSLMEQHIHGYGSQIVGFYFLDVPENSSKILFHDPRAGKVQGEIAEANASEATLASRIINFQLEPGLLVFTNSWLPHSFTRHAADKPLKFVHFNLVVDAKQAEPAAPAEVI